MGCWQVLPASEAAHTRETSQSEFRWHSVPSLWPWWGRHVPTDADFHPNDKPQINVNHLGRNHMSFHQQIRTLKLGTVHLLASCNHSFIYLFALVNFCWLIRKEAISQDCVAVKQILHFNKFFLEYLDFFLKQIHFIFISFCCGCCCCISIIWFSSDCDKQSSRFTPFEMDVLSEHTAPSFNESCKPPLASNVPSVCRLRDSFRMKSFMTRLKLTLLWLVALMTFPFSPPTRPLTLSTSPSERTVGLIVPL